MVAVTLLLAGGLIAADFGVSGGAAVYREVFGAKSIVPAEQAGWLRIPDLVTVKESERAQLRTLLGELRARHFKICALVQWPVEAWTSGVRAGGGRRGPLDLREAFNRARQLERDFGDVVDVWEIENEPDISFWEDNAESYAAFFKACERGLARGGQDAGRKAVRVIMAALALPPGPYLERLTANQLWRSTDAFNFHYYGYAEDLSGVYRQFRDAVVGPDVRLNEPALGAGMPVFMTEYGYGLLSGAASGTQEGRARQQRWFAETSRQLRELRPEAAMPFLLTPYLERGVNEFGLLTAQGQASPALVGLLSEPARLAPFAWPRISEARRSKVVVDFVAGEGLTQRKSFNGYFLSGYGSALESCGYGEVLVYNFSEQEVRGNLLFSAGLTCAEPTEEVRLAPGERRQFRVKVELHARHLEGVQTSVVWRGEGEADEERFVTAVWPNPAYLRSEWVDDFSTTEEQARAAKERLLARSLAVEEPRLKPAGRWLVTEGVEVAEAKKGHWYFKVVALPAEPLRPAMAELPLREGTRWPADGVVSLDFRAEGAPAVADGNGAMMDVFIRTKNGNLYQVWPRLEVLSGWQHYTEALSNFSMAFYGRAELPWRLADNEAESLVFFFWPMQCPTTFEIGDAAIKRWVF